MKKKKISLLCAAVLVIGLLAGCGASTKEKSETAQEPLRVAMDLKFPPFTTTDANGNPEGLEVDMAKALGEYLNRDVEIVNTDFSMLIPALDTGNVDLVISEMTIKDERKEKVDFSTPYLYGRTLALVNKDFAEANHVTDEMTPEEFFAIKDARFVGLAGTIAVSVPQSFGVEVEEVTEIASAIMEINNGTQDIIVGEDSVLGNHAAYPDTTIVYSGITDYSACGMAVKKGNTELLDQVNQFIAAMYEEGGFYITAGDQYDAAIGAYLQDETKGLEYLIYPPTGEGKAE